MGLGKPNLHPPCVRRDLWYYLIAQISYRSFQDFVNPQSSCSIDDLKPDDRERLGRVARLQQSTHNE
jgi:hypothetical protein